MANTYVDYTATAAQTDFAFSFPYLEDSHVVVEIDGVTKTLTTHYTITTVPPKVVLASGATAGQKVRVRRDSDADSDNPLVDFVDGSVLTESSLDRSYLHNLYLNEEIGELNEASLQKEVGGTQWDAGSLRIVNVTDPTGAQDASTKNYTDTQISNQLTGSSSTSAKYTFTGDNATTAFTFSPAITLDGDTMYDVAIDGVAQEPTVAYAIDATNDKITFTSAPATSANIVVIQRGYSVPVTTGEVDTSQLADEAVTAAKLEDDSVTRTKLGTDGVFDVGSTQVIVNNSGSATMDFRVEGDTSENLLFVDASTNRIGIGTDAPTTILYLKQTGADGMKIVDSSGTYGADVRACPDDTAFRIGGNNNTHIILSLMETGACDLIVEKNDGDGTETTLFRFYQEGNFEIKNTTSVPSTPTGGGVLYVESGALKYKGSSGSVTTLGSA